MYVALLLDLKLSRLDELIHWVDITFTAQFFHDFLKYIAIPILLIVIAYFVIKLLLNRYNDDKTTLKKAAIEQELDFFLTDLIFSSYTFDEIKTKIETFKKGDIFKNKWCKYLILNKLIHIKQNVREVNQNIILIIYKHFGLNKYSKKLLLRRKWYFKSLGIYHYQSLDYKIKKSQVKQYLNSSNKYLKSNALIAMIALSDEKFEILNNYKEKIPSADELKILDLIYHKKTEIPETINTWLTSNNNSVVILAIKLYIRYRETLSIPKITYLLKSTDKNVRKETILAIRELVIFDANQTLMEHFEKESDLRNKISIMKTLGIIGNDTVKDFAINLLKQEHSIDLKFEIINCIHKLDSEFFEKEFKKESRTDHDLIDKIVLHLNTPILN